MEVRRPIRERDKWKRRTEEWNLETGANLKDWGCHGLPPEQQDVKAVSVLHCAAITAPCNCCSNCCAEQSHKDNVHSSIAGETTEAKEVQLSLSIAQHHLPALDLFWASFFMRVQLTSLLLISPGLWSAGSRLQLNMLAPYACGFAWSDMVQGCMVYTERTKMAAVSCGISYASAVSTPLWWILKCAI